MFSKTVYSKNRHSINPNLSTMPVLRYRKSRKVILALMFTIMLVLVSSVQAASWSAPLNLTNSPQTEADACISGNGEKVAFARNDGEDWEIFVVNSDGVLYDL